MNNDCLENWMANDVMLWVHMIAPNLARFDGITFLPC